MVHSSIGMISGRMASMALGFGFWLAAARLFPPATVGLTAGAVSSMMLCTQLALLGVGSAFIIQLPRHERDPDDLVSSAVTVVAAASVATGAAFLVLSAVAFADLRIVAGSPGYSALFLVMAVLGTVNVLLDQVSIATRHGSQVLTRNLAFGGIALLAVVGLRRVHEGAGSAALFACWVAAGVAACAVGALHLRRSFSGYRYRPRIRRDLFGALVRDGLPNHALTLTERAPGLLLPVIVTEVLSPTQNAFWYAVWMMAWVLYIVPISMGMALFAEGSRRAASLARATRTGLRASLLLGMAGAVALAAGAELALGLLGSSYADAGATPLRILVLAVVPLTFVQLYSATCRATGRVREAILVGAATGVVAVTAAAAVAPAHGLRGMAAAWVATQSVAGLWALFRVTHLSGRGGTAEQAGLAGAAVAPGPLP